MIPPNDIAYSPGDWDRIAGADLLHAESSYKQPEGWWSKSRFQSRGGVLSLSIPKSPHSPTSGFRSGGGFLLDERTFAFGKLCCNNDEMLTHTGHGGFCGIQRSQKRKIQKIVEQYFSCDLREQDLVLKPLSQCLPKARERGFLFGDDVRTESEFLLLGH